MSDSPASQPGAGRQGPARWVSALTDGGFRVNLACFVALTVFFLASAAGNLGETDDVYAFAYRAENFPLDHLSDPRLMLFHIVMRLLYLGASAVGLDVSALLLMRGVSALCAAAALLLFLRIARCDLKLAPETAVLAAAVLGSCYGFWRYAAEAEVYIPAIFLILLVFRGLSSVMGDRAGEGRVASLAAAAAFGGLAGLTVLFYQPSVIPLFFAFPLLLLDGRRIIHPGCYLAAGGAVTLAGYIIGYLAYWPEPLGVGSLASFLSQRSGEFIVPPLSLRTVVVSVVRAVFALGHDIAAATWIFAFDSVATLIQRAFSYNVITEEIFLAKRAGVLAYLPIVTLLLLGLLAARVLVMLRLPALGVLRQRRVVVILVWTAINGAIVGRLNPAGVEAWIMLLPPLVLILAVIVIEPCLRKGGGRWLAGLAGVLFLHNVVGGMALVWSPDGEYDRVKGAWVIAEAEPRDLVLVAGNAGLAETLRYLSAAEVALVPVDQVPAVTESLLEGDVSRLHTRTRGRDFSNHFLRSLIRDSGEAGGRIILFNEFFEAPTGPGAGLRPAQAPDGAAALQEKATKVHDAAGAGATYVLAAPKQ